MSLRLAGLIVVCLFSVALLAAPVSAISISVSTGNGGSSASSSSLYSLDDSTSLTEKVTLGEGDLQKSLEASGTGKNEISQSVASSSSASSSLQSSVNSEGSLALSSAAFASEGAADLSVGLAAEGDLSLSGQASQGFAESAQEAGVAGGIIYTSQSLSAGEGASSSQSTDMAGLAGYVASAALSEQNEMVASGSFSGEGQMSASLGALSAGTATASGQAAMDGVTYLNDATFQEISSDSLGMRMMSLRETENGIGTFDLNVFNREAADSPAYDQAADTAGGLASSYDLTGYRWNQNNPQIQLYYNPTGKPSGLVDTAARDAIAAAANTWDDAVGQNLFKDTSTVIVDSNKAVTDPFATGTMDGYNVNGWWNLGGNTLGTSRWWYNPDSVVGGYKSILETDVWYSKDKTWTTDWNTAVNNGNIIDLQSVAVHELGHSIGLGDLYTLSDARKNDYAQVMNLYDAPQRTLGNGDLAGAQKLYGVSNWLNGDFNGDGKTDLIELTSGDRLITWLSDGDGTYTLLDFTPWSGYLTNSGKWETGDINGDGKTDLTHFVGGDYINGWLSKGDGTYTMKSFTPWRGYVTSSGQWETGDINGDGKTDLTHLFGGDYINGWLSKGDGSYTMSIFTPWRGYVTSSGQWLTGDINGDSKTDLTHLVGGDYINGWLSKGDGSYTMSIFTPWPGYVSSSGQWLTGDINGDSKTDLTHLVGGDYLINWLSDGDGTYTIREFSP